MGAIEYFEMDQLCDLAWRVRHRPSQKALRDLLDRWDDLAPLIPSSSRKEDVASLLQNTNLRILGPTSIVEAKEKLHNICLLMNNLSIWLEGYDSH